MEDGHANIYKVAGAVNGAFISSIIRDTSCSWVIVTEKALSVADTSNCKTALVAGYKERIDKFPILQYYLLNP